MSKISRWLASICAVVLSFSLLGVTPTHAAPSTDSATPSTSLEVSGPRSLGTPLQDTLLIGGIVGFLPTDGSSVLWSVVSGTPAYVHAVDPTAGEIKARIALPGGQGAYAIKQTSDGTLYVATYNSTHLFRIDPGAEAAVDLGNPAAGEGNIWSLALGEDGKLYGGTSPGGKVFSYDLSTGATHDYGQLAPGETYVKSLAWYDGKLYGGAYANWVITQLDPVTGARTTLPLPDGLDPSGKQVYDINVWDGYLYARGYAAQVGTLHVYDLAAGAWIHTIEGAAGLDVSEPDADGRVYFFRRYEEGSAELVAFQPRTGQIDRTGLMAYGRIVNSRGIGWAQVNDPDYPGESLVALGWRSMMFQYNPTTGAHNRVRAAIPGQPTPVLALTAGDDGTVWAGGFLQGGVARVNVADSTTDYWRFAQVESLLWDDGHLMIGAYPDARVYRYDTASPWFSPEYSDEAPTAEPNPTKLLDLKLNNQSRLKAMTSTAGKIVAGSSPANDNLGGAIAVIDREAGTVDNLFIDPITDEGIFGLTSDGQAPIVYGVTTVVGGLSTTPQTQDVATVFAMDINTGEILWEAFPSQLKTYQAITMDALGQLWVIAGGKVLQLDPANGDVVRTIDTGVSGSYERLALSADKLSIYALTGGEKVTMVDALTGRSAPLFNQTASQMVFTDGQLVFAVGAPGQDNSELVAWQVPTEFPPIELTVDSTSKHEFTVSTADLPDVVSVSVTITDKNGKVSTQVIPTGDESVTVRANNWASVEVTASYGDRTVGTGSATSPFRADKGTSGQNKPR